MKLRQIIQIINILLILQLSQTYQLKSQIQTNKIQSSNNLRTNLEIKQNEIQIPSFFKSIDYKNDEEAKIKDLQPILSALYWRNSKTFVAKVQNLLTLNIPSNVKDDNTKKNLFFNRANELVALAAEYCLGNSSYFQEIKHPKINSKGQLIDNCNPNKKFFINTTTLSNDSKGVVFAKIPDFDDIYDNKVNFYSFFDNMMGYVEILRAKTVTDKQLVKLAASEAEFKNNDIYKIKHLVGGLFTKKGSVYDPFCSALLKPDQEVINGKLKILTARHCFDSSKETIYFKLGWTPNSAGNYVEVTEFCVHQCAIPTSIDVIIAETIESGKKDKQISDYGELLISSEILKNVSPALLSQNKNKILKLNGTEESKLVGKQPTSSHFILGQFMFNNFLENVIVPEVKLTANNENTIQVLKEQIEAKKKQHFKNFNEKLALEELRKEEIKTKMANTALVDPIKNPLILASAKNQKDAISQIQTKNQEIIKQMNDILADVKQLEEETKKIKTDEAENLQKYDEENIELSYKIDKHEKKLKTQEDFVAKNNAQVKNYDTLIAKIKSNPENSHSQTFIDGFTAKKAAALKMIEEETAKIAAKKEKLTILKTIQRYRLLLPSVGGLSGAPIINCIFSKEKVFCDIIGSLRGTESFIKRAHTATVVNLKPYKKRFK